MASHCFSRQADTSAGGCCISGGLGIAQAKNLENALRFFLFSSLQATRAAFPPKTCPRQPGFQPINVVHPFRPPPHSIPPRPRDPKPARPPPPAGKSPLVPTKTVVSQAKLPPPKKPLPSSPVRTPVVSCVGWLVFPARVPHFWLPVALLEWTLLGSCHGILRDESVAVLKKAR